MTNQFFIVSHSENADTVSSVVGPFGTMSAAARHLKDWMYNKGGADQFEINDDMLSGDEPMMIATGAYDGNRYEFRIVEGYRSIADMSGYEEE